MKKFKILLNIMCNKINNGPVTSQLLPDTQRLVANKANGQLIQNGERHFRLYFSKDKKENEHMFRCRLQPSMFTRTLQDFSFSSGRERV